ncbi:MAG: hypothetical protein IPH18_02810 [Chitinophagaceae bacterium]|nr:hypothetical protein [Chitinophagaceae bacterium]MBK8951800.1 hypothetical protein [Chitinophagaceae bacterium]
MYPELYSYLIKNNKLTVPGIGTFLLEQGPATIDFPGRKANAPAFKVSMAQESDVQVDFYGSLGALLGISAREAVVRFNDFAFDLKKKINEGAKVYWTGIGTISKGLAGEMKFQPEPEPLFLQEPVRAEKVIRDKAEHMVRVGEQERTSVEMNEFLNQPVKSKSLWWVWVAVLTLLSFLYIGWYFSEKGVSVAATGSQSRLNSIETNIPTYRSVP